MASGNSNFGPCSPLFIVSNVEEAVKFYVEQLGFECRTRVPEKISLFAIVGRGSAQLMLKFIDETIEPLPNPQRHEWARWDAFIYVENPDALAAELKGRHTSFHQTLIDTDENLRGFEIKDHDGYVIFFGRPI